MLVVHPLGSGDHLVRALSARGVAVEEDRERWYWRGQGRDGRTAVEAFAACAGEFADSDPSEEERLADRFDGGDLLMFEASPSHSEATRRLAVRNDEIAEDAFTLVFSRQFSFVDVEGQHLYMERMGLEIWTPLTADLAALKAKVIYGYAGPAGSPAELADHKPLARQTLNGAPAWHQAVASTAVYQRALTGPIDYFLITQGPV
jgi:hypothetical protein